MVDTPLHSPSNHGESLESNNLADLLRAAGVASIEELPLEVEAHIQSFLRRASGNIARQLAGGMKDPDPRTRMKVATYLGQIAKAEGLDGLRLGIADVDPRVRMLSLISLRDCGFCRALPWIIECMQDLDDRVRGAAFDAFSCLSNHAMSATPFSSPDEIAAAVALAKKFIADRDGWSEERFLADGFRARGHAVALDFAPAASIDGLLSALADRLPFVRRNAVAVLARLAGIRRTLDDEINEINESDVAGERDYDDVRREALARLVNFYRLRLRDCP